MKSRLPPCIPRQRPRPALHFAREPRTDHRLAYQRLVDGMRLAGDTRPRPRRSPPDPEVRLSHNTHLLKDIVAVARDGAEFYEHAERAISDPQLKQLFGRMAGAKRELASSLSSQLRSLGTEPPRDGTAVGALRETYAKLRAALGRDDARVYTDQLEQAEDRLLGHMREAIRDAGPEIRSQLQSYLPEVQACHDQMRSLKARMHQPTLH